MGPGVVSNQRHISIDIGTNSVFLCLETASFARASSECLVCMYLLPSRSIQTMSIRRTVPLGYSWTCLPLRASHDEHASGEVCTSGLETECRTRGQHIVPDKVILRSAVKLGILYIPSSELFILAHAPDSNQRWRRAARSSLPGSLLLVDASDPAEHSLP